MPKIELNKDDAVAIIKLASKLIIAIEGEKDNNELIRKSEDEEDHTDGYVNKSGSFE